VHRAERARVGGQQVAQVGDDEDLRQRKRHALAQLVRGADGVAQPGVDAQAAVVGVRQQAAQGVEPGLMAGGRHGQLRVDPGLRAQGHDLGDVSARGAEAGLVEQPHRFTRGQVRGDALAHADLQRAPGAAAAAVADAVLHVVCADEAERRGVDQRATVIAGHRGPRRIRRVGCRQHQDVAVRVRVVGEHVDDDGLAATDVGAGEVAARRRVVVVERGGGAAVRCLAWAVRRRVDAEQQLAGDRRRGEARAGVGHLQHVAPTALEVGDADGVATAIEPDATATRACPVQAVVVHHQGVADEQLAAVVGAAAELVVAVLRDVDVGAEDEAVVVVLGARREVQPEGVRDAAGHGGQGVEVRQQAPAPLVVRELDAAARVGEVGRVGARVLEVRQQRRVEHQRVGGQRGELTLRAAHRHRQTLVAILLEELDLDAVPAGGEPDGAGRLPIAVQAVVVQHRRVADQEPAAVVGADPEVEPAGLVDAQPAAVADGELVLLGDHAELRRRRDADAVGRQVREGRELAPAALVNLVDEPRYGAGNRLLGDGVGLAQRRQLVFGVEQVFGGHRHTGAVGQGHFERERPVAPALEVVHAQPMQAGREADAGRRLARAAVVVVDEQLVAEPQPGAVVGGEVQAVEAGLVDLEKAVEAQAELVLAGDPRQVDAGALTLQRRRQRAEVRQLRPATGVLAIGDAGGRVFRVLRGAQLGQLVRGVAQQRRRDLLHRLAGRGEAHRQLLPAPALEEGDPDTVPARGQADAAPGVPRPMQAVVVQHLDAVDEELGAVVGVGEEAVEAGLLDVDPAVEDEAELVVLQPRREAEAVGNAVGAQLIRLHVRELPPAALRVGVGEAGARRQTVGQRLRRQVVGQLRGQVRQRVRRQRRGCVLERRLHAHLQMVAAPALVVVDADRMLSGRHGQRAHGHLAAAVAVQLGDELGVVAAADPQPRRRIGGELEGVHTVARDLEEASEGEGVAVVGHAPFEPRHVDDAVVQDLDGVQVRHALPLALGVAIGEPLYQLAVGQRDGLLHGRQHVEVEAQLVRRQRRALEAGAGPGDLQQRRAPAQEIIHGDAVQALGQRQAAGPLPRAVPTVVVDDPAVADVERAAVLGVGVEGVEAVLRHLDVGLEAQRKVVLGQRHGRIEAVGDTEEVRRQLREVRQLVPLALVPAVGDTLG
jgi:hypothetical protein